MAEFKEIFIAGDRVVRQRDVENRNPSDLNDLFGVYDEALSAANDMNFGLTSGIVTQSLACATYFRRNARKGAVIVNLPTAGTDHHVPFGAREQSKAAAEFYAIEKTAYISAGEPS